MVYGRVFEGSGHEIGAQIAQMVGDRRVSVLLMEDAAQSGPLPPRASDEEFERVMEEIRADAASVPHVDDSREAIYTRREGE
jgi:hypothetical protein